MVVEVRLAEEEKMIKSVEKEVKARRKDTIGNSSVDAEV